MMETCVLSYTVRVGALAMVTARRMPLPLLPLSQDAARFETVVCVGSQEPPAPRNHVIPSPAPGLARSRPRNRTYPTAVSPKASKTTKVSGRVGTEVTMTIVYKMTPGHPFPSAAWMVTGEEPTVVGVP